MSQYQIVLAGHRLANLLVSLNLAGEAADGIEVPIFTPDEEIGYAQMLF